MGCAQSFARFQESHTRLVIPAEAGIPLGLGLGRAHPARVPSAILRTGHFSLRAQREVTKRKCTPDPRPPGILPSGFASGLRRFSERTSVYAGKRARVVRAPASRLGPPPARRGSGAPGWCGVFFLCVVFFARF